MDEKSRMEIKELNQRPGIEENVKLNRVYHQFAKLISELRKKDLPDKIVNTINNHIDELNSNPDSGKGFKNQIRKKQSSLIRLIEKELKLVPKNYYRNFWMSIGIGGLGVPLGAAYGMSIGNMAFMGIGLPMGLAVGIAIGVGMDKKAFKEGRQLDLEIKY